jgi:hypothetical protein
MKLLMPTSNSPLVPMFLVSVSSCRSSRARPLRATKFWRSHPAFSLLMVRNRVGTPLLRLAQSLGSRRKSLASFASNNLSANSAGRADYRAARPLTLERIVIWSLYLVTLTAVLMPGSLTGRNNLHRAMVFAPLFPRSVHERHVPYQGRARFPYSSKAQGATDEQLRKIGLAFFINATGHPVVAHVTIEGRPAEAPAPKKKWRSNALDK